LRINLIDRWPIGNSQVFRLLCAGSGKEDRARPEMIGTDLFWPLRFGCFRRRIRDDSDCVAHAGKWLK
jgi:hypothetical protein